MLPGWDSAALPSPKRALETPDSCFISSVSQQTFSTSGPLLMLLFCLEALLLPSLGHLVISSLFSHLVQVSFYKLPWTSQTLASELALVALK